MSEQELDLLKVTAVLTAKLGAGAAEIEPVTKLLFGLNFGRESGWMDAFVLFRAGE